MLVISFLNGYVLFLPYKFIRKHPCIIIEQKYQGISAILISNFFVPKEQFPACHVSPHFILTFIVLSNDPSMAATLSFSAQLFSCLCFDLFCFLFEIFRRKKMWCHPTLCLLLSASQPTSFSLISNRI